MDKYELKTKVDSLGTDLRYAHDSLSTAEASYQEIRHTISGLYELARKEATSEFHAQLRELLEVVDNADAYNDKVKSSTGDANARAHSVEEHLTKIETALRGMLK